MNPTERVRMQIKMVDGDDSLEMEVSVEKIAMSSTEEGQKKLASVLREIAAMVEAPKTLIKRTKL